MIISKSTQFKDLKNIQDGDKIEITKELALNRQFLTMLMSKFPNSTVTILSGYNANMTPYSLHNPFFNIEETNQFIENLNYVRKTFNQDLTFDDMFSAEQALEATRNFNSVVKHIKSLKVNGRPLSPLEKFFYAYDFVTQRCYNEEGLMENSALSRNLINVLTTDKIVCVGYSNWLIALLTELGVPCTYQSMITSHPTTNEKEVHATVCVKITDPLYGVNGIFHSDPTADASKEKIFVPGQNSFDFALVPYSNLKNMYTCGFELDKALSSEDGTMNGVVYEVNTPKQLSALFPEINGGKTQDVVIKETIERALKENNTLKNIEDYISIIDESFIDFSFNREIETILDVDGFCEDLADGRIKQRLNAMAISLLSLNLSKPEIKEHISNLLTREKIEQYYTQKYALLEDDESTKKLITASTDKAFLQTTKLANLIEKYNTANIDKPSSGERIKNIAESVCSSVVEATFSSDTPKLPNLYHIKLLQEEGFYLPDILEAVKDLTYKEDLFKHYLSLNPHLYTPLSHPEDEFYTGMVQPFYIMNHPYQDLFDKIVSNTKRLKSSTIQTVFKNLFIAEGCSLDRATLQTETALKNTDINDPFVFEQ